MAEPVVDIDQENKLADDRYDDEENGEAKTSLVAGLNLVVVLSSFSFSAEERVNFDEMQEMETAHCDRKARHAVSRSSFQARRRQVNPFPAVERQTSKVHTKIRDSRHCRRF